MKTSADCLGVGLAEDCGNRNSAHGETAAFRLGVLVYYAGQLIEGDKADKAFARRELKKLIGRGRCILNARDLDAGLKKGQVKNDA